MSKESVSRTGHTTAWARTLSRLTDPPAIANTDELAGHFLLPYQRVLNRAPRFARWLVERLAPGGVGYFNARTRYFDAAVVAEAERRPIDQVVILGAGFDSRAYRLRDRLGGARVFEVDHAHVLAAKAVRLARVPSARASDAVAVPIDFDRERLEDALRPHGYDRGVRTLFLWEGVTYYLAEDRVDAVLQFIRDASGPESAVVFDYVTRAFFEGDHSSYGSRQLAEAWRRMGNVHRSGIASVKELVERHGLALVEDVDAEELERRYLSTASGVARRAWGCMRIAHARR